MTTYKIYTMKTQKQIRDSFWDTHQNLTCKRNRKGKPSPQNQQPCDTRMAFIDYVDMLACDGIISQSLAARVTL